MTISHIHFCLHLGLCRYTYTVVLEVQHMIDTTWIMSPRPVVPWGLRKALNWVRPEVSGLLLGCVADQSSVFVTGLQIDLKKQEAGRAFFYVTNL